MLSSRLQAITIMELVVVLFLSSILVSFSYLGYEKLQEHFHFLKKTTKDVYDRELVYTILGAELEHCKYAMAIAHSLVLMNANGDRKEFKFVENKLIRSTPLTTDTLPFEGFSAVTFNHLKSHRLNSDSIVAEVTVKYDDGAGIQTMHWAKEYSASDIINLP